MIFSTLILSLVYCHIKLPETAGTQDKIVNIIALTIIYAGINSINTKFGPAGSNPAIAAAYIAFIASQVDDAESVNHYLWVYMISPFIGAACGGILYLIHSRCANTKGRDNSVSIE